MVATASFNKLYLGSIDIVEAVQHRAIRYVSGNYPRDSSDRNDGDHRMAVSTGQEEGSMAHHAFQGASWAYGGDIRSY